MPATRPCAAPGRNAIRAEVPCSASHSPEARYTGPGQLGPYTDFELGMLNGKLSALRWVLGADWDFLDT